MSERRLPRAALLDPGLAARPGRPSSSRSASGEISPTGNVNAESATKPPSVTPTSTERMSPVRERVRARDAVHDHLVRRDADRGRVAPVALEGRRPAVRADELLGERVELGGRDARPDVLGRAASASRRRRARRAPICSISAGDLRMITPPPPARAPPGSRPKTSSIDPVAVDARRALPVATVVLDERGRSRGGRSRAAWRSPRACRRAGPPRPPASASARRTPRRGPGARGRRSAADRCSASSASSASACARLRGKAVEHEPRRARRPLRGARGSARSSARPGRASPAARIGSTFAAERRPLRDRRAEHVARRDVRESRTRRRSASPAFPCPSPAARGSRR